MAAVRGDNRRAGNPVSGWAVADRATEQHEVAKKRPGEGLRESSGSGYRRGTVRSVHRRASAGPGHSGESVRRADGELAGPHARRDAPEVDAGGIQHRRPAAWSHPGGLLRRGGGAPAGHGRGHHPGGDLHRVRRVVPAAAGARAGAGAGGVRRPAAQGHRQRESEWSRTRRWGRSRRRWRLRTQAGLGRVVHRTGGRGGDGAVGVRASAPGAGGRRTGRALAHGAGVPQFAAP